MDDRPMMHTLTSAGWNGEEPPFVHCACGWRTTAGDGALTEYLAHSATAASADADLPEGTDALPA